LTSEHRSVESPKRFTRRFAERIAEGLEDANPGSFPRPASLD